jgi:nanoRNase/pAp phosphatase (c-di-AMP/oligoRNAs hydrolase)
MVRRLVLGDRGVSQTVVGVLSTWAGSLTAVVPEDGSPSALRDGTVDVRIGDPGDPTNYPDAADVVFVTVASAATERVTRTAVEAFPDARVVAAVETDADRATTRALERITDQVVDARAILAGTVLDAARGPRATRLQRLCQALRDAAEPLAVVTHDNPDPDAIGSALALVAIARSAGVEARAYYSGEIAHQENRALVNLLDIDLCRLEETDLDSLGGVALVDHSRPGVNDGLPASTPVDVVIDHHPPRAPIEARFVDLRSEAGSTSALLTDYLTGYGLEPDRTVATSLLYGIRVDTDDFTREVTDDDFEAAASLVEYADADVLSRVESPSMSPDVFETLASAIRHRRVRGDVLVAGVGRTGNRDALAQAADLLVGMEGVNVALVHGFVDDTVFVSGRLKGSSLDLGETLRDAFGSIGSAGGHANMAGAQIPLGILADVGEDATESLEQIVDDVLAKRFLETVEDTPSRTPGASDFAFEPTADGG